MSLRDRVFSAKQVKTILSIQVWKQSMIKTKKEFDRLLAESEQAFQAYIFCPSEENEKRYQTLKYQYQYQVLESDLRLIIKWSK
jgi:hypothetical protein